MIDRDHDSIDYKKLGYWVITALLGVGWWVCIWQMGFFRTITWTIVGIAVYMLWNTIREMRV